MSIEYFSESILRCDECATAFRKSWYDRLNLNHAFMRQQAKKIGWKTVPAVQSVVFPTKTRRDLCPGCHRKFLEKRKEQGR